MSETAEWGGRGSTYLIFFPLVVIRLERLKGVNLCPILVEGGLGPLGSGSHRIWHSWLEERARGRAGKAGRRPAGPGLAEADSSGERVEIGRGALAR